MDSNQEQDPISHAVIGRAMEAHRNIGSGMKEPFYHQELSNLLNREGIEHLWKPRRELIYRACSALFENGASWNLACCRVTPERTHDEETTTSVFGRGQSCDRQSSLGRQIPVSDLCDKHEILPTQFYGWQKLFFENGAAAFEAASKRTRREDDKDRQIAALQAKLTQKNEVVAELLQEHVQLKKRVLLGLSWLKQPVPQTVGPFHGGFSKAWQSVGNFVSPPLSAWVAIAVLWLLVRSIWFRSRLRKARRLDRGRAVELLRELNVAVTLRVTSRTSSDSEAETTSDFGWRRFVGRVLTSTRLVTRSVTATLMPSSPRVRLLIVPSFSEPAAFGIWRPTIVLPPSCEALPREELRAVLAHELGHIVRGDVWWLLIGRLLTTALGFQPLNRIARREWTAAAECLCDSWAVDRGVERLTLARCLTALAEHRVTGISLADALAAVGSPSSLRTRIERLVGEPVVDPWTKPSRRWLLSGSMTAVALLTLVIPLPQFASTPTIANEPDEVMIAEVESELLSLESELQLCANRAAGTGDPQWQPTIESLRLRADHLRERWKLLKEEP